MMNKLLLLLTTSMLAACGDSESNGSQMDADPPQSEAVVAVSDTVEDRDTIAVTKDRLSLEQIQQQLEAAETKKQIHLVQHSRWNEEKTTKQALKFVKQNTDYIKISDANRYLNLKSGDAGFAHAARNHSVFGGVWQAAFDYYDPNVRLDFSDAGELLHILGLGEIGIKAFQKRFLLSKRTSK